MTAVELEVPYSEAKGQTLDDDTNQLPAYSLVDESDSAAGNPHAQVSYPNPVSPAAYSPTQSYLTAEHEKEQLQQTSSHPHPALGAEQGAFQEAIVLPSGDHAGHASATTLARGLHVPSSSRLVSSGFPYPEVLRGYGVSPEDWSRFTSEITEAASMTANDWALAIGGGAGTFLVSGLFIGYLGIIPAWFIGRTIHSRREAENLAKARNAGDLEQKLLQWNQDFFSPKGLLIRLDLPGEGNDISTMDIHSPSRSWGGCCSGSRKNKAAYCSEKKAARMQRRMEKKALKAVKDEEKLRNRAAKKGRIVILPMNRAPVPAGSPAGAAYGSEAGDGNLYNSSIV